MSQKCLKAPKSKERSPKLAKKSLKLPKSKKNSQKSAEKCQEVTIMSFYAM